MANIKSAKKRIKVAKVKTERNRAYKSAIRTLMKNAINSPESEKQNNITLAIQKLDKAASKGILHKNTVARKKSYLMKACSAR